MAITCDEILATAEDLLASATNEVLWRNATSLAYYAAFHRCIALAQQELPGGVPPRVGHKPLADALRTSQKVWVKSIAIMLDQCRGRRAEADYELNMDFTKDAAATVITLSRRVFAKADAQGA